MFCCPCSTPPELLDKLLENNQRDECRAQTIPNTPPPARNNSVSQPTQTKIAVSPVLPLLAKSSSPDRQQISALPCRLFGTDFPAKVSPFLSSRTSSNRRIAGYSRRTTSLEVTLSLSIHNFFNPSPKSLICFPTRVVCYMNLDEER